MNSAHGKKTKHWNTFSSKQYDNPDHCCRVSRYILPRKQFKRHVTCDSDGFLNSTQFGQQGNIYYNYLEVDYFSEK